MTTNDLWHEVDIDHEAVALERVVRTARAGLAKKVSFLMEASSTETFEDRLALIDGDIDEIVRAAAGDGAAYNLARTRVVDDFREMFARGDARRRRDAASRHARTARHFRPVVDEQRLAAKHAATQAEVDAWLDKQDPGFAEWARPYAQRMVYGANYNRSIATNLPEAARAYKRANGDMQDRQFRYVRSQLDAALGSERGEAWYWDEAQGEYTQRLDGTIAKRAAEHYVVRREYVDRGSIAEGPFDSEEKAREVLKDYPDEYMVATGEELDEGPRKAAAKVLDVSEDPDMGGTIFHTDKGDFELIYFAETPREKAETDKYYAENPDVEPYYWYADFPGQRPPHRYRIIGPQGEEFTTFSASGNEVWSPYDDAYDQALKIIEREAKITSTAVKVAAKYVRTDEWNVSYEGPPGGSEYARSLPQVWTLRAWKRDANDQLIPHPDDGKTFPTMEAAQEYAASVGLLIPYVSAYARKQAASYSATAPANFTADFDKVSKALEDGGWVVTHPEGFQYLSPDAPPDLVRVYNGLLQMGYAQGHFARKHAADDWDSSPEGIDAMWNARYWAGEAERARQQEEAKKRLWGWKGQEVTVVKGRKIPIGTKGIVFYSGEGQWGWRIGFKTADGQELWTNLSNVELTSELSSTSLRWRSVDGVTTTEVRGLAMTAVRDSIGAAWAITSPDGQIEYVTGKSRTIDSAKTAMERRLADIFGQDPDLGQQSIPPKKKKKVPPDAANGDEDTDAEDEDEDEEDTDVVEDDAEGAVPPEVPPEEMLDDQVETVDPLTLDVGDTVTVSYTMATGETGEVEGVFVRNENDIAFFSGPNGEFGVAERDGAWIDSEGNQFTFSYGSPDETGAEVPTQEGENPATPAEEPPVADAEDKGDTEYKSDDEEDEEKKKGKDGKPPWLKGKGSTMTGTLTLQPDGSYIPSPPNSTVSTTASQVVYTIPITPTPIRSMAELVTAIGALAPNLRPEQVFEVAKAAILRKRAAQWDEDRVGASMGISQASAIINGYPCSVHQWQSTFRWSIGAGDDVGSADLYSMEASSFESGKAACESVAQSLPPGPLPADTKSYYAGKRGSRR